MRQPDPKAKLIERHQARKRKADGTYEDGDLTETYLLDDGTTEQFVNGKFTVASKDAAEAPAEDAPVDSVKSGPVVKPK
jgi:hypothetical protein